MRILIAEDEASIANALTLMLVRNKYTVDTVYNGTDAYDYISEIKYDAVVLDIMMPGMDGLEVLKKARKNGVTAPVLFLTAKGEVEDRVEGLEAGADDYLPKPFAMTEFLARVKALTRRSETYTPDIISFGNTELDLNGYFLTSDNGKVRLNNKEFQLMELFMRSPQSVFSSERLMDRVWGPDTETEIDAVWTYIGFLRKKLREIGSTAEIKTIRGAGYSLEEVKC